MTTKKKTETKKTRRTARQQISLSIEPGTKVQITLDVGGKSPQGKIPVTVSIDHTAEEEPQPLELIQPERKRRLPLLTADRFTARLTTLKSRLDTYDLAAWLFVFAVAIYLVTRLIGLTRFPMYFFTDEGIQTQSIIDLINHKYRNSMGVWLPAYFRNGDYYNLSLSVYLQWLPYLVLGKSAIVTRATSVFVTLIAAISVGFILRDAFKLKYWWTGALFLSITPAWFLHSRTAFETAEFVAFYAGTLWAYLLYRYKSPRYIYVAILLGAFSFYTYSPAQLIIGLTIIALLISDWRYHWENRRFFLTGLLFAIILALPYLRSWLSNTDAPFGHLRTLWSYWFEKKPLSEKIVQYFSEYGFGLSPYYWYIPNERDLPRHLMKDYGNIMRSTLPFALLGMAYVLRNIRMPACRAILIALLVSPAAAALVQVSITRVLMFVVPASILTALGFEQALQWIEAPRKRLAELGAGLGPTSRRIVAAALILLVGIPFAFISKEDANRLALSALTILFALQVSGIFEWFVRSFRLTSDSTKPALWNPSQTILAILTFMILAGANVHMLNDALRNGPLWFRDYGMGGMQYGAFQIFDITKQYLKEHPDTKIVFSPNWANGTDVVARFFLGDPLPIQIASIRGHVTQKLPLDENTLFIITPQEYAVAREESKFTDFHVETIVEYPDGEPGFYFIRTRYVDNIDEVFAAEKAARQVLRESTVTLDGQDVKIRFSYLDSDFQDQSIALLFDDDPYTLAKTYESNPFVIEMTFPEPRTINGFSIIIGSAKAHITLKCYSQPGAEPVTYTFDGQGTSKQPQLSFDLPGPTQVQVLQVEMLDPLAGDPTKIHIWELSLR